jgi:hypothetical protein
MRHSKPDDDLPVDREQLEPIKRTPTDHGTVIVSFGRGWIAPHEPRKLPSLFGYRSTLNSVFLGE